MPLTKFIIFFSAFITKICVASLIIQTSKVDESGLVDATVSILERCYTDQVSTVGIAGASAASISKTLSLRETVLPIILIDETSMDDGLVGPESKSKLRVFIVTVTDTRSLAKTLLQIKKSRWWNHMASFFLLDWPTSKTGCSKAYEMLWETWKIDVLNSNFICLNETRGRLIYTFNPYTSKAPAPWQLENTYKGVNNHIWSLFVQVFREDKKNCAVLDFDKTTDLGGYEIRATAKGMEGWGATNPKDFRPVFSRVQNISAEILMSSINAKWTFRLYPSSDTRSVDKTGKPIKEIAETVYGLSDIGLNIRTRLYSGNCTTSYPHLPLRLCVLTQYRGDLSQLEKIGSVLDRASHIGLLVACLITLLFFKYFLCQPVMPAVLDLVRTMSVAPLAIVPRNLPPRIYLGSLLIFTVTINGIYQGKLASLLTKPVPRPNMNSLQDLAASTHTIHGHQIYRPVFGQSQFDGRYVELEIFNCSDYVRRDANAACTSFEHSLIADAAKYKLHLSARAMIRLYGLYLIRPDWPLENRINTILQRCFDGGIMLPPIASEVAYSRNTLTSYQNRHKDQHFKPIKVEDIGFAFGILGIGLACSIVAFIYEVVFNPLAISKMRKSLRKMIRFSRRLMTKYIRFRK